MVELSEKSRKFLAFLSILDLSQSLDFAAEGERCVGNPGKEEKPGGSSRFVDVIRAFWVVTPPIFPRRRAGGCLGWMPTWWICKGVQGEKDCANRSSPGVNMSEVLLPLSCSLQATGRPPGVGFVFSRYWSDHPVGGNGHGLSP